MRTFGMHAAELHVGDMLAVVEDGLYGAFKVSYAVSRITVTSDALLEVELRERQTLKRILRLSPDALVSATQLVWTPEEVTL